MHRLFHRTSQYIQPAAVLVALLLPALAIPAAAQNIGISGGVPYTSNPGDTARSLFLPSLPSGPAGQHGFLKNDGEGNFQFTDGAPARFYGVTLQWAACYPDSAQAVVIAARLRKLGVNLVRFQYMDNAFDWGDYGQVRTYLDAATGFRSLHAGQIRRLDWFVYQLKQHGIYSYFILQSARTPRASDGLGADADSALWLGKELNYLYPQARAVSKDVMRLLLDHVNVFTGTAYKNEPALAMVEGMDQGSIISLYRLGYTEYRADQYGFSWRHSRRLDTLWNAFLKKKYTNTQTLTAAWKTSNADGFPNYVQEGSFEGEFDRYWQIDSYDGVNVTTVLSQGDSVPNGQLTMKLRVRNARKDTTLYNAFMIQPVMGLQFNTLYQLSFKAKASVDNWPVVCRTSQASDVGMYAGLNVTHNVSTFWKTYTATFLVPFNGTAPINLIFWYGSNNGDLSIDDIQIKRVDAPGVVSGETLENYTVARVPMGRTDIARALNSKRIEDQSEFYMGLERDYNADLTRFLRDTLGAKQPFTGAGHYWASGFQEAVVQGQNDFTLSAKNWDWVSSDGTQWEVRNYSPLRRGQYDDGATITAYTVGAHRRQPFIASFAQPYPNRYQGEAMLWVPAYSSLQDWDGVVLDMYADDVLSSKESIDSAAFGAVAKNPVVTALMPVVSHLFRNRFLSPAQNTIPIQHSEQQARIFPRMYDFWYDFGVPGGFFGRSMMANRVVIDSLNAVYPTQYDDIAFAAEVQGQCESDTRQILWEYSRGSMSVDAPMVQGATGYLSRTGAITLRNLDVKLLSGNETSTVLWTPVDSSRLGDRGRSLLVLASRTEPTGWHWIDSMHADKWGTGPMLLDPVRVRLTIKPGDSVNIATIRPLDSAGMPFGSPIVVTLSGGKLEAVIDQSQTHAMWYGVDLSYDPAASVISERNAGMLTAQPSIVTDRSYISVALARPYGDARLEVFDAFGRSVRELYAGPIAPGQPSIRFDAEGLPAGVYIVRLSLSDGAIATTKVTVVR